MAELSPAAQAVLAAIHAAPDNTRDSYRSAGVAALRAAADQVVPDDNPLSFSTGAPQAFEIQRRTTRRQLLAIAAELEGQL
jgi:hypothetical protein